MEIESLAFVSKEVREVLSSNNTGEIVMVTSNGIYLRLGAQMVFLCDAKWGVVPIGLSVCSFNKIVKQLHFCKGQIVTVKGNTLIFPSGTLHLLMNDVISKNECLQQPEQKYIKQAAQEVVALQREHGMSILVKLLVLGYENDDNIHLNPYCAKAYPYLERLMSAISNENRNDIRCCVDKILGLGIGLTPSADDVMLGMLYVFRKMPQKAPQAVHTFSECVLELCDSHTNQVSSAYLKAIIRGSNFERMEQVWNGLCGMESLDISRLTQVGSNSGTEMLLGMLVALRICGYDVSEKEA